VQNLSDGEVAVQPSLAWGPGLRNSKDKKATTIHPPTLWVDGKRVQEDIEKVNGVKAISGKISWTALQDTYFVAALLPENEGLSAFVEKAKEGQPIVGLSETKKVLQPGGELGLKAKAFAGRGISTSFERKGRTSTRSSILAGSISWRGRRCGS